MAGEVGLYNPVTEPYIRQLLQRADAASQQPYQPYSGPRVAPLNATFGGASLGIRSLSPNNAQMQQAAGLYSKAASGLGGLTNFQSNSIGSTYNPNMISMFARPRDATMFARPEDVAMYTKPGDTKMFARPSDVQMFARPDQVGMFAGPDDVRSEFQAGEFDRDAARKYMNPYQQEVTDIAKREAARMFAAQAAQQDLQSAARGAFGGSRNEIAQQEAARNNNQLLNDIQVKGLSDSYLNAQQQYERDRQGRALQEQFALDAAKTNAGNRLAYGGMQLQNDQFNSGMGMQYGMAGLQNQQFNRGMEMDHGKTGLQNQQFNTANAYQFGRDRMAGDQFNRNLGMQYGVADLGRQQFNSDLAMRYGLAGVDVGKFNETSRFNSADMKLRAAVANEQARLGAAGVRSGAYGGMLNAAGGLSGIGNSIFNNSLQKYNAQANIGQLQQATQQRALDTQYQNWTDQRNWNKNNVNYLAGILNSNPINPTYGYTSGSGGGGGSTLSNVVGGGLAIYGGGKALGMW
jgi:hypothetical protein